MISRSSIQNTQKINAIMLTERMWMGLLSFAFDTMANFPG